MDLFVINRYDGFEENEIKNQESLHLERLRQRIEERKKAQASQKNLNKQSNNEVIHDNKQGQSDEVITIKSTSKVDDSIAEKSKEIPEIKSYKSNEYKKSTTEFKVLGSHDFEKKPKVERVLPYWLSHAISVSKNLQTLTCNVEEQDWLNKTLKETLLSEGVTQLFPVQEQVIPFILQEHSLPSILWPQDVCVSAPTGSGKTLSFVLPIIQILMNDVGHHIRALIVLPVQELAAQVAKVFRKYCTNTGLKVGLLSGSTPWHKEQQQILKHTESLGWISIVDIIVCTAGRLVEHFQNTEGFSLKHLKFLVIDEADRIMDNIQNDWLYHMYKHIKLDDQATNKIAQLNWEFITNRRAPPHKLLFSATLSPDPELLEQWGLFQPKLFSVSPISDSLDKSLMKKYTTPDELKEQFVVCAAEEKPLLLYNFLIEENWDKVLVFTNSAQSAHRLTVLLNVWAKERKKVAELSSALDRSSRETVLKKFNLSEINVIISTDALARGIDIPHCNYVISYDPPKNIKTYIHRVGRTGRAGNIGNAVTVLLQNQIQMFKEMIQSGGKSDITQIEFQPEKLSNLIEGYQVAIQATKHTINDEINTKVRKSIELKRGPKSKSRKRKHSDIKK
ncbi:probable ATP-dependent RNA helicase Dbp73D [Leptidea sinapis]|uniref:probable ATP-dependent RNA helicase Dbp73D n=1 Tax=Leptidea sinapis TaxID=189913 RepID=UPI00212AAD39|nr:probable ATP-dependent RNA helicase Dbp73D [Leptidea sinapis]